MNAPAFVATLIAPGGATLSQAQIDEFAARLKQIWASIQSTTLIDAGRAADIFFTPPAFQPFIMPQGQGIRRPDDTFDILIQPKATRRKKLLLADMESTIIEQEMLDELAAAIGVGEHVAAITRRAMNGELDFAAALSERVALLKGQPASLLDKVASRMNLMPGAEKLLAAIKQSGGKAWLVSGGFTCFVKIIAERLGFDNYYANELIVDKGFITGQIASPILDKNSKKTLLEKACATYGCTLADTLAVGDGANDVPMLQTCIKGGGLGVAFRAKPAVREAIPSQINHADLSALIYAQGLAG